MNLKELLEGTGIECSKDVFINDIKTNSKEISKNDLFVAIKGTVDDGNKYIDEAINNGASAILVNNETVVNNINKKIIILKTKNTRLVLSKIASNYYKNPSKDFILIGIIYQIDI